MPSLTVAQITKNSPNVLFITYNGHGLGHITRLMAVAKHAQDRFTPVFLTLSEAFPLLREHGFVAEYMPSFEKLEMSKDEWQPLLASRLINLLEHTQPRVIVWDLVRPPPVLASIRAGSSGIEFIWCRRGMWEGTRNRVSLRLAPRAFDSIVEPGDIAAPIDSGLTPEHRENVTAVAPVVLVAREEQLERVEARRRLGIPSEGRAVLVNISDSDPVKLSDLVARVRDAVREAAANETIHLFAPLHVLHQGTLPSAEGVIMRPVYPVAEHLRAFDGVVSTAGYNTFHEIVASGLPAVFVARDSVSLDDQKRRAMFVELCGRGFFAESFHDGDFREAVERMLAPGEAAIAAEVTKELGEFNGAEEFADVIAERCEARSREPFDVGIASAHLTADSTLLERIPSGRSLASYATWEADRLVVVILGLDDEAIRGTAEQVASLQKERQSFKPVFLIDSTTDAQPLGALGFQFETVMSAAEWSEVGFASYEAYLEGRIAELHARYRADQVVNLSLGDSVDEGMFP